MAAAQQYAASSRPSGGAARTELTAGSRRAASPSVLDGVFGDQGPAEVEPTPRGREPECKRQRQGDLVADLSAMIAGQNEGIRQAAQAAGAAAAACQAMMQMLAQQQQNPGAQPPQQVPAAQLVPPQPGWPGPGAHCTAVTNGGGPDG